MLELYCMEEKRRRKNEKKIKFFHFDVCNQLENLKIFLFNRLLAPFSLPYIRTVRTYTSEEEKKTNSAAAL